MIDTPHLSVRNLNVFYGHQQALKDINLEIPRHKLTVIIGPSGCGKSTLLKTFNRLLETEDNVRISGEVVVDGKNVYDPSEDVTQVRKMMGLLSQRPCPLPMSIYDNVAFGPRIHGEHDRAALDRIVELNLQSVGLWDEVKERLRKPAAALSIGQQQRLCLARGLAVKPEIILGDESTSALDPISSKIVEERFQLLKNDYTIVLVTHILRQAKRLADYVVFLYMGELIECGPAKEIFENPKESLTREYIFGSIS